MDSAGNEQPLSLEAGNMSETGQEEHHVPSVVLMRQQLEFFRTQLATLRAQHSMPSTKHAPLSVADIQGREPETGSIPAVPEDLPVVVPSLVSDILQLRSEIADLRTQQQQNNDGVPLLSGSTLDDIQQEMGLLRSEISCLRMQLDPPQYTPPPTSRRVQPPA